MIHLIWFLLGMMVGMGALMLVVLAVEAERVRLTGRRPHDE